MKKTQQKIAEAEARARALSSKLTPEEKRILNGDTSGGEKQRSVPVARVPQPKVMTLSSTFGEDIGRVGWSDADICMKRINIARRKK